MTRPRTQRSRLLRRVAATFLIAAVAACHSASPPTATPAELAPPAFTLPKPATAGRGARRHGVERSSAGEPGRRRRARARRQRDRRRGRGRVRARGRPARSRQPRRRRLPRPPRRRGEGRRRSTIARPRRAAATRDMYLGPDGALTDKSLVGHLAAGVPGSVAGLAAMHERLGSLPWRELVEPAIELARGHVFDEARRRNREGAAENLLQVPGVGRALPARWRAARGRDRLRQSRPRAHARAHRRARRRRVLLRRDRRPHRRRDEARRRPHHAARTWPPTRRAGATRCASTTAATRCGRCRRRRRAGSPWR